MTAGPYGLGAELAAETDLPFFTACWDARGRLVAAIYSRSAASARELLEERPDVEAATITGPESHERWWRDARTREWRSR